MLEDGGKRASARSWKSLFVSIRGTDLLCFDKDKVISALRLSQCKVEVAESYTKKDFVFRVVSDSGSEFLFNASSKEDQVAWLTALLAITGQGAAMPVAPSDNGTGTAMSIRSTSGSSVKDKKSMFDKILNRKSKT